MFGFLPNSGQFPPAVRFVRYANDNFSYLTRDSFVLATGVRIQLANIDPNAQPAGDSPTTTIYNFYQTNDTSQWIANAHLFGAAKLNNVYPGVSAAFTTTSEGVSVTSFGLGEVIFSIAAGADPSPIQVNVLNTGATPFAGPGGIWFAGGRIPGVFTVSAQATQTSDGTTTPVTCGLTINSSGTLSIQLPDRNAALETDVAITFPDYDLTTGQPAQGLVALSVPNPSSFGPDGTLPNSTCGDNCTKAVVANLDANGNPLWVTLFGGSGSDEAWLATTTQGGVSVTGTTESTDFPVTSTAPYATPGSEQDAFLAYFDLASGQLLDSTYVGLPGAAYPTQQIANSGGQIALSGGYSASNGSLGYIALWQPSEDKFLYRLLTAAPVVSLAFDTSSNLYFASVQTSTTASAIDVGELDSGGNAVGTTVNINLPAGVQTGPIQLQPSGANGLWVVYPVEQEAPNGASVWAARILPASGQIVVTSPVADQGSVAAVGLTPIGNLKLLLQSPAPTETTTPDAPLVAACPNTSYFIILSPQGQPVYATYVPATGFNFAQQNESAGPPAATISCIASTAGRVPSTSAAAGEMITLTGGGFGPSSPVYTAPGSDGTYPLTASGYSVKIGGLDAPIFAVARGLIAVQVPFEIASITQAANSLTIEVFQSDQLFQSISVNPTDVNLNLFDTGDRNNSLNLPALAALNEDGTVNTIDNPAPVGSIVSVFGSGAGILSPPLQTGAISPIPPAGPLSVTQLVDGCGGCSQIWYLGSAPGLTTAVVQINVQIPSDVSGTGVRPLGVSIGLAYSVQALFVTPPTGIVFVK